MEKLIELLNQFEKEKKSGFTWRSIDSYDNCVYGVDCDGETEITMYSDLYSKYYGFIEWLLRENKIDLGKIKKLYRKSNENNTATYPILYDYTYDESLLMFLAIQDEPIEFLISLLK